eukprot:3216176-Amphidinium_carterae.1
MKNCAAIPPSIVHTVVEIGLSHAQRPFGQGKRNRGARHGSEPRPRRAARESHERANETQAPKTKSSWQPPPTQGQRGRPLKVLWPA